MTFHITSHSDLWKEKSDIKLLSNMHTLYTQCQYNETHFPCKKSPHHARHTPRHLSPFFLVFTSNPGCDVFRITVSVATKSNQSAKTLLNTHQETCVTKRLKVMLGHFCTNFTNWNFNYFSPTILSFLDTISPTNPNSHCPVMYTT